MPTDVYACANAKWYNFAGHDFPICELTDSECKYNLKTPKKCEDWKLHATWKPDKKPQNYDAVIK